MKGRGERGEGKEGRKEGNKSNKKKKKKTNFFFFFFYFFFLFYDKVLPLTGSSTFWEKTVENFGLIRNFLFGINFPFLDEW